MGSYSHYAFDLRFEFGRALMPDGFDGLQAALAEAAPHWSSAVSLSRVGRWRAGARIDMTRPGGLREVLQAHLPGGSKWREPLQPAWHHGSLDAEVILSGQERIAHVRLEILATIGVGSEDRLWIETTRPDVSGEPADRWASRVFAAICNRVEPSSAYAGPFGEKMARRRRRPDRDGVALWLTYVPVNADSLDPAGRLRQTPGVTLCPLRGGTLIRLSEDWRAYRRRSYWDAVDCVDDLIARLPPRRFRPPPTERRRPTLIVPGVSVRRSGNEITEISGGRATDLRIGSVGLDVPGAVIQDVHVDGLEVDNAWVGPDDVEADPVVIRRCQLRRGRISVLTFGPTLFDECEIDGLSGPFRPTAMLLFRHVTFRGPIDSLDIRAPRQLGAHPAIDRRHREHYGSVDWAIDITQARFARCDLGGVPGHLVRRDPATQILVTTERVRRSPWRAAVGDSAWVVRIERLLEGGLDSEVFVACPHGDRFEESLEVFERLRAAGVAEPD